MQNMLGFVRKASRSREENLSSFLFPYSTFCSDIQSRTVFHKQKNIACELVLGGGELEYACLLDRFPPPLPMHS